MSILPPVALTIDLELVAKAPPSALVERLSCKSPPASPGKAGECSLPSSPQKEAQAKKLHEACLQAVKDRAARDVARIEEARLRRLRATRASREKIERTLHLNDLKTSERKREAAAKAEEAKQRRCAAAERFMANRALQEAAKKQRGESLIAACETAYVKRTRAMEKSIEKSSAEFKHAIAVAESQKLEREERLSAKKEKLDSRLSAAVARREMKLEMKSKSPSPVRVHRVLNDVQVSAGLKKRSLMAAMDRAATNRENLITDVKLKATAHLDAVKTKAAAAATRKSDAEERKKGFERMVAAEIARSAALKLRYGVLGDKAKAKDNLVLVFDSIEALKSPSASLLRRLAAKKQTLLTTAEARHAGALARRRAINAGRATKAAKQAIKMAAAASKRGLALAAMRQKTEGRVTRSLGVLSLREAARKRSVAAAAARVTLAAKRRADAADAATAKCAKDAAKCSAAAERHAFHIQCRSKAGLAALQSKACKQRAALLRSAVIARGDHCAARCTSAAARKAEILDGRIATAKASAILGPAKAEAKVDTEAKAVMETPVQVA